MTFPYARISVRPHFPTPAFPYARISLRPHFPTPAFAYVRISVHPHLLTPAFAYVRILLTFAFCLRSHLLTFACGAAPCGKGGAPPCHPEPVEGWARHDHRMPMLRRAQHDISVRPHLLTRAFAYVRTHFASAGGVGGQSWGQSWPSMRMRSWWGRRSTIVRERCTDAVWVRIASISRTGVTK